MQSQIKILLAFSFVALCLMGCSQSRRIAKAKQTLDNDFFSAAQYCGQKFPIRDTTMYLPGEVRFDTLYQLQDVYIPVDCPPSERDTIIKWNVKEKIRTITKNSVDTIVLVKENIARVAEAEKERDQAQQETTQRYEAIAKQRKWLWWLTLYAIGTTVFIFRKPIFSFFKTLI